MRTTRVLTLQVPTLRVKLLKIVTHCGNRICTQNAFHNFTFMILKSRSYRIMLAFRVGVCEIERQILNPVHSHISTGWAIQRKTRFYLPWEVTKTRHYPKASKWDFLTQNSTGPSRLDCVPFTIYLTRTPEQPKERRSPWVHTPLQPRSEQCY